MPDIDEDEVPFSSHLNELRRRLIWSLLGVFVAFAVVFGLFADDIVRYVKDIAVVTHDPGDETYADVQTAIDMPYQGVGSTWTLTGRQDGRKVDVSYEVTGTTDKTAEVRKTVRDGDEAVEKVTFTHTYNTMGATAGDEAINLGLPDETISVPAGEFECFVYSLTEVSDGKARVTTTWVAKQGGVVVRIQGGDTSLELSEYTLAPFEESIQFTVIASLETFSTTMRVSLYAALVFAYPWVMLQIYLFVAPGLYRHERNFFRFAIPSIFVLFMAGAAFGRYILLPISIPFLLGFNIQEFGVETNYSLGQFLGLVFAMTFGLGFIFQIPLLVAPVIRFGLLTPEFFKSKRRYTILISVIIGAIVSPSGSPIDMVLAGAPVFFLVEGGVWMGRFWKRAALRRAEKEAIEAAKRGEEVDPEALAGGLAVDLEKRLNELAAGGAREFARELIAGFRESGKDIESIFDDDYSDDEKPPTEVKLKTPKRKRDKAKVDEPKGDLKPDQMHDVKFVTEETTSREPKKSPESGVGSPESEKTAENTQEGTRSVSERPQAGATDDEGDWPDRPWDERVDEDMARYIEDRITQRLEQFFEREVRPWMARVEHEIRELKDRNGDNR